MMLGFVLDASVSTRWALDDAAHDIADVALNRSNTHELLVPALWWFETRNILVVAERRKRSSVTRTNAFLQSLQHLRILVDRTPDEGIVMRLVRRHGLTVYDSAYLELAMREALPLATLDKRLAAAATAENVPLIG